MQLFLCHWELSVEDGEGTTKGHRCFHRDWRQPPARGERSRFMLELDLSCTFTYGFEKVFSNAPSPHLYLNGECV